jgi:hypothetical protein
VGRTVLSATRPSTKPSGIEPHMTKWASTAGTTERPAAKRTRSCQFLPLLGFASVEELFLRCR